jgi:hypothetical protein
MKIGVMRNQTWQPFAILLPKKKSLHLEELVTCDVLPVHPHMAVVINSTPRLTPLAACTRIFELRFEPTLKQVQKQPVST